MLVLFTRLYRGLLFVVRCVDTGLCDELITGSEETYKVCMCVCVCVSVC